MKRLIQLLLLVLPVFSFAQEVDEIVTTVQEELALSDDQAGEMKELMVLYRGEMDRILAKYEDQEEPDVGAMISEIRDARDEYRKKLGVVLDKEQMKGYMGMVDSIIGGMFNDIAEIRLLDLQDPLELTDDQVGKLKPVMGSGLHGLVKVVFENAGTRLSVPKKISIANRLKKLQKETNKGVQSIMTSGQYEKWQAMKEAAKNQG